MTNSQSHKDFIALEDCETLVMQKENLEKILKLNPKFESLFTNTRGRSGKSAGESAKLKCIKRKLFNMPVCHTSSVWQPKSRVKGQLCQVLSTLTGKCFLKSLYKWVVIIQRIICESYRIATIRFHFVNLKFWKCRGQIKISGTGKHYPTSFP